jgi:hypothetical protein
MNVVPSGGNKRRFDHSANAFAVTYPGAKSEIALRRMSIHRTSRSNRLAPVNLEPHRFASRRRSGCDVIRCYSFRMRNEVAELPATFGKAGCDSSLRRIVDINVRPIRHWPDARNVAGECSIDDCLDRKNSPSPCTIDRCKAQRAQIHRDSAPEPAQHHVHRGF